MKKLKKDMVKLGLILVVLFIILYLAIYFFELRGLALNLTIWGSLLVVVALSFSLFSLQRKRMSEVNDITDPDERITAMLEFKSPSSECYEYISSAYVEKNDIDNAIKYMHLAMDLVSQGKPVNLRSDHELLKFHQEQFLRIQYLLLNGRSEEAKALYAIAKDLVSSPNTKETIEINLIILSAQMALCNGDTEEIKAVLDILSGRPGMTAYAVLLQAVLDIHEGNAVLGGEKLEELMNVYKREPFIVQKSHQMRLQLE